MYSSKVYRNNYALYDCDGKCNQAWGISARPTKQLSNDPNDVYFIGDEELFFTTAPDSDIVEGGDCKLDANIIVGHNKWCIRQCERVVESISDDRLGPDDVHKILIVKRNTKQLELKNGWYNKTDRDSNNIIKNINDL